METGICESGVFSRSERTSWNRDLSEAGGEISKNQRAQYSRLKE
jgi:hypothetical protein